MSQTVQLVILSVLCSSIFVLGVNAKKFCPAAELIHPCFCRELDRTLECSNITDMATVERVFEGTGDKPFFALLLENSVFLFFPAKAVDSQKFSYLILRNVKMASMFDQVPSVENNVDIIKLHKVILQHGVIWEQIGALSKLTLLELQDTEVKSLGKSFVQNTNGSKLTLLEFVRTRTSRLHDRAFANLVELKWLKMESNQIKVLKRSMFPTPARITTFDFYDNYIETLPEDIFSDMPNLRIVKLVYNKISTISKSTFGVIYDQLENIDVSRNRIDCDCSLRWLISKCRNGCKHIPSTVSGYCFNPLDKRGRRISDIDEDDLDYCRRAPMQQETNNLEVLGDWS